MKEKNNKFFSIQNIILFIVMLAIPLTFFFFLKSETGSSFGSAELIVSIMLGIFSTLFLIWVKSVIFKNPYLGAIIGVTALAVFEYSLFYKYEGAYTMTFVIVGTLIVLAYLGYYFLKYKNSKLTSEDQKEIDEEFEE